MLAMFPGLDERVITVVTPADVARRAATILVDIPPVPKAEPALDTVKCQSACFWLERKKGRCTICL